MSHDNDTIPQPTTKPEHPQPLQREAVVLVHDRGRFGVLVALCTLAGVAVGFVLGSFAGASGSSDCSERVSQAEPPHPSEPPEVGMAPNPHAKRFHQHHQRQFFPDGIDIWNTDPHAWLGVNIEDDPSGARVTRVMPGSPAAEAGVQDGDVIQSVDGESVATASQLSRLVRDQDPGQDVEIVLDRNGDRLTIEATLGKAGGQSRVRIR